MSLRLLAYDNHAERSTHEHRPGQLARLIVSDYERQRLRKEVRARRWLRALQWFLVLGAVGWLVYAVEVAK